MCQKRRIPQNRLKKSLATQVDVDLRTLQQPQKTLDENEEWIARNSGKLISK
jgi:hypothetical protein